VYDLPKFNQGDISHLSKSITRRGTEAVMKTLPTKKIQRPDRFTAGFYQTFKEELAPVLLKLLIKLKGKEHYKPYYPDIETR
jgi:hypothetical protein